MSNVHANGAGYSVLIVDDDEDTRYSVARILKKCNCNVAEVASVEEALIVLAEVHFDIVFSDMCFHGGMDGEELLEIASEQHLDSDFVMISCSMDSERKEKLIRQGAALCLEKPFFKETCLETLATLEARSIQKAA